MTTHSTRRHRLPKHRPDYILIPAPEDVPLSQMGEKTPLPAIVVTPSSPSCSADFSVAFRAPPEKPTVTAKERLFSLATPLNLKARTTFLLLLLLFIMACHLFTHRLAASHPHLQFGMMPGVTEEAQANHLGGFNWKAFWGVQTSDIDGKREFFVTESPGM
ncbi:hypothetical protein V8E52_002148 [Russula decolorans]